MFSNTFFNVKRFACRLAWTAFVLLSVGTAQAHLYPAEIEILAGQTNVFSIVDQGTCPAVCFAEVTGEPLVTVTPDNGFGVQVDFTVVAGTNIGTTIITVQWVGVDAWLENEEGPCNEDTRPQGRQIQVKVVPEPTEDNTANNPSSGRSGDPVNLATGELYFHEPPDLDLGGPMGFKFQRYYASRMRRNFVVGVMGDNWRHNFEWKIHWTGNLIILITSEGKVLKYVKEGDEWKLKTPTDNPLQVVQQGTEIYVGDARNHRIYRFNSMGQLIEISDGKGNSLLLTYDLFTGKLYRIQDHPNLSQARVLELFHAGDNLSTVMEMTNGVMGRRAAYSYVGNNLAYYYDSNYETTYYYYYDNPEPGLFRAAEYPNYTISWIQTWDDVGKVAKQSDLSGLMATYFNYGPPQTPGTTIVTNADNGIWTYVHNEQGTLVSVTDPDGKVISFGATTNLLHASITNRIGGSISRAFDPATGAVTIETDENGNAVVYTYANRTNALGIVFRDLVLVSFPDGTTEQFQYDASGNLLTHTNRAGDVWSFVYNTNGQVLQMTNPLGGVTTNAYDNFRNLSTVRDPAGNLTTYHYDAHQRLNKITWADGSFRLFEYDSMNRVISRTDERGFSIRTEYDEYGNLISLTNRLGAVTTFSYDLMNRLTTVTHDSGGSVELTYDVMGRLKTMTGPNNNTFVYTYDNKGRLVSVTDSLGLVKNYVYDANGHLISIEDPLGALHLVVDPAGRVRQLSLDGGTTYQLQYDSMDRIVGINVDGLSSTTTYDSRGLTSGVSLGSGAIEASYTFNGLGQLTLVQDANGQNWTRQYDSAGRLIASSDPASNTITYSYDNRNRISQVTFPGGLGTCTYTYDATGNLTRALYSDGTDLNYTYNAEGEILTGPGLSLAYDTRNRMTNSNGLSIEYDAAGRVTRLDFAPGKFVTYEHDERDRLVKVADWLGGETVFTYNGGDLPVSITRPNGTETIYGYDAARNLAAIEERKSGAQIASISLARDPLGKLLSASRNHPAIMPPLSFASGTKEFSYTSDSMIAGKTYDALGRLLNDGVRSFQWNLASHLVSYIAGGNTVTCSYDGEGHRVSRNDSGVNHAYVWNYAFERPCIAVIRNGATAADIQYNIFTPDGELLYTIAAVGNARRFYHFDEMGNTHFVTDDSGNVVVAYRYSPYGEVLTDSSDGAVANPFTWLGRYSVMREGNSSLYCVGVRYYDSSMGRFISRDPVVSPFPLFVNPYQYAGANPLLYRDPSGRDVTATDVASVAVNTYATGLGFALDYVADKGLRALPAAGNGPAAQALHNNATKLKSASNTLNNVAYGAAVVSAGLEAVDLRDRLSDIKTRRRGEESRLVGNAQRLAADARALYEAKKITLEEYTNILQEIDAALKEQLTANSDVGFVDAALESTKSMLKSVGGLTPVPGFLWDKLFNWFEGK